jgi:hypothetical protein
MIAPAPWAPDVADNVGAATEDANFHENPESHSELSW